MPRLLQATEACAPQPRHIYQTLLGLFQPSPISAEAYFNPGLHNRGVFMRDVFVQKIAESAFFRFRCFSRKKLIAGNFLSEYGWVWSLYLNKHEFFFSEYDMTSGPGANKHELF